MQSIYLMKLVVSRGMDVVVPITFIWITARISRYVNLY